MKQDKARWRALLVTALLGTMASATAPPAFARSSHVSSYPPADVWPTAVRYLRIDRGATLREKDAEAGYVLFDLPEGSKIYRGSLELVRTADNDDREATRIVVNIPDLPRHVELTLLDKLALKLRDEYGTPAAAPPRRPTSPPGKKVPDGGVLPRPSEGELPRPERR
ncbi:MAG TPA: hypothetical protein VGF45_18300 [Polyangia bacterium]